MNAALSVVAILLACVSTFLIVVVPIMAVQTSRRMVLRGEDRHISPIVVIGSMAGCLAVLVLPIGTLRDRLLWAWAPAALEALVLGACAAYWRWSGLADEAKRLRRAR